MHTLAGDILTQEGWVRGTLQLDAHILHFEGESVEVPKAPYILPGFIDLHVHGGMGQDMMQGADAIRESARFHARHGTTALLATSVTAPYDDIEAFLMACQMVHEEEPEGGARVLGVHLEGPFINPEKLGAQPAFARETDLESVKKWLELAPVRVMTLAPEMDKTGVAEFLIRQGVRVQIGHSLCSYAQAHATLEAGAGITHLYNAMSGLSHRDNGITGAALAHADYAEIIPDLIHVEAGAILAARRAIPNLYGVTDAMSGAGMPDGEFRLGAHQAIKRGHEVRLKTGELAGSALTMDQAFRNLVSIGFSIAEASQRLSTIPANWLGLSDIGEIKRGTKADILIMDEALSLTSTYIGGNKL